MIIPPMHIAIDAHLLGKGVGGVERVVRMLVERIPALMPEVQFTLLLNRRYEPDFVSRANVAYHRLLSDDPLIQRSVLVPLLMRKLGVDILHVQRIAPPFPGCRIVAHVHDLLPLTEPSDHPGLRNGIVRWLTPSTLRNADHILTVSETVKTEIARLFPAAAGKITAVHNGVLSEHFCPLEKPESRGEIHCQLGIEESPYAYFMGAISPRKNLEVVLRGWANFARQPSAFCRRLVISGMNRSPGYGSYLRELAMQLEIAEQIIWTGFVTETERIALLRHACVFLAPSRGEGFDLPALEAMACGVPVVCSNIAVHDELFAGCAAFFSTDEPTGLAAGIVECCPRAGNRAARVAAGRARARDFTWEASARGVAAVYSRMVPGYGQRRSRDIRTVSI